MEVGMCMDLKRVQPELSLRNVHFGSHYGGFYNYYCSKIQQNVSLTH